MMVGFWKGQERVGGGGGVETCGIAGSSYVRGCVITTTQSNYLTYTTCTFLLVLLHLKAAVVDKRQ